MGILQFYGRIRSSDDVWVDAAPKLYGFSVCTYPSFPGSMGYAYNLSPDYLLYPENNILDAMGNTPMIKLNRMVDEDSADVYVKYEGINVGGSIKSRTAYIKRS